MGIKLYNLISDVSPNFKLNERTSSILITLGRVSVSQRSEMLYQKFISFFYQLETIPWVGIKIENYKTFLTNYL